MFGATSRSDQCADARGTAHCIQGADDADGADQRRRFSRAENRNPGRQLHDGATSGSNGLVGPDAADSRGHDLPGHGTRASREAARGAHGCSRRTGCVFW